jgi:hypothetical protein
LPLLAAQPAQQQPQHVDYPTALAELVRFVEHQFETLGKGSANLLVKSPRTSNSNFDSRLYSSLIAHTAQKLVSSWRLTQELTKSARNPLNKSEMQQ